MVRVAAAGVVFTCVARLVERLEMLAAVFVVVVVMVDQLVLELGGFHLGEVSVLDAEDPVRVVGGVDQVVRHHQDRQFQLVIETVQKLVKRVGVLNVDPRRRLVEDQQVRPVRKRPGDEDPLELTAGKLTEARRPESFHPDQAQNVPDPLAVNAFHPMEKADLRELVRDPDETGAIYRLMGGSFATDARHATTFAIGTTVTGAMDAGFRCVIEAPPLAAEKIQETKK